MRKLLAIFMTCTACAHDVNSRMAHGGETGRLVVRLASPASNTSVSVNGELVCDDEHTGKVTVDGVPVGPAELQVTAQNEGWDRPLDEKRTVEVKKGKTTSVQLATPSYSTGYWIATAAVFVILFGIPIVR
jgi:hypothetical protein